MKNHKWGTESFNSSPVHIVLFVSRNKDNRDIEGYKERRRSFITHDKMGSEELHKKFMEFVYSGLPGEMSRLYYSVNERDPEKIHRALLHFLIDNPDFNICDIAPKLAGIANTPACKKSSHWMFDFDIDDADKAEEFKKDILAIDPTVKVDVHRTPHGYAIVVDHGFDVRTLYEKWNREETELKKDDLLLAEWAWKEN